MERAAKIPKAVDDDNDVSQWHSPQTLRKGL